MDFSKVHPKIKPFVETAWKNTASARPENGVLITDDYNPVEYYDPKNEGKHPEEFPAMYERH